MELKDLNFHFYSQFKNLKKMADYKRQNCRAMFWVFLAQNSINPLSKGNFPQHCFFARTEDATNHLLTLAKLFLKTK